MIDVDNLFEEDLEEMRNSTKLELIGLIGFDFRPKNRVEFNRKFYGNVFELSYYPLREILSIKINGEIIEDFVVNKDNGIIYFDKSHIGNLVVEYISGFSDEDIEYVINPIVDDLIRFSDMPEGVGTSIKEGDVSISYDTSNSKWTRLWNRIDDLKLRYNAKIRLI